MGQPPDGFGPRGALGCDVRQCIGIVLPVISIAPQELEADASSVEMAQLFLEAGRSPILQRLHAVTLSAGCRLRDDSNIEAEKPEGSQKIGMEIVRRLNNPRQATT